MPPAQDPTRPGLNLQPRNLLFSWNEPPTLQSTGRRSNHCDTRPGPEHFPFYELLFGGEGVISGLTDYSAHCLRDIAAISQVGNGRGVEDARWGAAVAGRCTLTLTGVAAAPDPNGSVSALTGGAPDDVSA